MCILLINSAINTINVVSTENSKVIPSTANFALIPSVLSQLIPKNVSSFSKDIPYILASKNSKNKREYTKCRPANHFAKRLILT